MKEVSEETLVYEYSKYNALQSVVGPFWAWFILWFSTRGIVWIFAIYMIYQWYAGNLRPDHGLTLEERTKAEDAGSARFPADYPKSYYWGYNWGDDGKLISYRDSHGNTFYGDPLKPKAKPLDGRRTERVPASTRLKMSHLQ